MIVVLGEMDVTRVDHHDRRGSLSVHKAMGRTPPTSGGHQRPRDGSGYDTFPLDDIHQAWIDEGLGDNGQLGEDIKEGLLVQDLWILCRIMPSVCLLRSGGSCAWPGLRTVATWRPAR